MMYRSLIIALFLAIAWVRPGFAQTDGSATFQVTTVTAGGNYSPRNVMAIWVTDANTNFVKTLKRQAVIAGPLADPLGRDFEKQCGGRHHRSHAVFAPDPFGHLELPQHQQRGGGGRDLPHLRGVHRIQWRGSLHSGR
jgi:hypothetical protein